MKSVSAEIVAAFPASASLELHHFRYRCTVRCNPEPAIGSKSRSMEWISLYSNLRHQMPFGWEQNKSSDYKGKEKSWESWQIFSRLIVLKHCWGPWVLYQVPPFPVESIFSITNLQAKRNVNSNLCLQCSVWGKRSTHWKVKRVLLRNVSTVRKWNFLRGGVTQKRITACAKLHGVNHQCQTGFALKACNSLCI